MACIFLLSDRFRGLARVLLAVFVCAAPPGAPAVRAEVPPREVPALAGHAAEAAMRDAEAERRHRRLFFDSVAREEGTPGVSCDHRAARPETVAGRGEVLVVLAEARPVVRLWVPPEADGTPSLSPAAAEARAWAIAGALGVSVATGAIDRRAFAWCR